MKTLLMASAVGALITVAGCAQSPRDSAATSGRLDCPETRGQLTLVSQTEDGQSCRYKTRDGADVELRLVPVQGGPKATLARLEAELSNLTPPEGAEAALATPAQAEDAEATAALAASTVAQAEADAGGDNVRVSMPGGKVDANDESVSIALPGLKIDAGEDEAQIKIGPINIDAADDGATVRIYREVRLKGESLARERRGIRATYILAGGRQPGGTTYVGLEAGGPKAGPLTVAIVSSATDPDDAEILDDIQDLVRENGGV
jgi:hypothetical protein